MIYIEKNQQTFEDKNMRVFSASGNYDDNQLVEVYDVSSQDIIIGSFAAQFVKYGSIVYKFSNIQELGEEIFRIDPESTHSMAAYVRMQKELLKQITDGSLENNSLDQVMIAEDLKTENNTANAVSGESISASSESLTAPAPETVTENTTNLVSEPIIEPVSTTTSSSVLPADIEVSTTTESLPAESIDLDITNTTPELVVANSTSTTEI